MDWGKTQSAVIDINREGFSERVMPELHLKGRAGIKSSEKLVVGEKRQKGGS